MRESAVEPLGEEELQMPDLETSSAPLRPEETEPTGKGRREGPLRWQLGPWMTVAADIVRKTYSGVEPTGMTTGVDVETRESEEANTTP